MSPFTSILSFFQCLPGVFILRNHLPPPPMENHFPKENFFGGLFANWDVTEISCIKCQEGWNNLPLENPFKKINPAKMLMYLNASFWINPAKMLMYLNASCWINPAKMLMYLNASCWIKKESAEGLSTKFWTKDWGGSSSV